MNGESGKMYPKREEWNRLLGLDNAGDVVNCLHRNVLPNMKPTIPEVMPMVREYRDTEGNGAGGSLHIVLDDGNVEDYFVSWCVEEAEKKGDVAGANLGRTLLKMSKTQRRKISANFYS